MIRLPLLIALAAWWSQVAAHLVITYPGWRGNNLISSGMTADGYPQKDGLGVFYNSTAKELEYPYGMQWTYPCKDDPHGTETEI